VLACENGLLLAVVDRAVKRFASKSLGRIVDWRDNHRLAASRPPRRRSFARWSAAWLLHRKSSARPPISRAKMHA